MRTATPSPTGLGRLNMTFIIIISLFHCTNVRQVHISFRLKTSQVRTQLMDRCGGGAADLPSLTEFP